MKNCNAESSDNDITRRNAKQGNHFYKSPILRY
jgi:hypothetical protein